MDRANILLVDDQPENLLTLEALLADLGQTIVKAASGEEALRYVLHQDFAVILLDVNLNGISGLETASLIRGRERSQHTPIIFLTGFDSTGELAIEGYNIGAVDFLTKPIIPQVLRAKVNVFVELFQQKQALQHQLEELDRLNKDITRHQQLELELQQQREWFRTTLASIGDGVIVTDEQANISFMNSIAENLTQWPMEEAVGKPLHQIFNIANHDTRQTLENPIDKVLRDKVAVALANNTLLIAKDGTEIPIADSSAPIIDEVGILAGAILVFRDVTKQQQAYHAQAQLAAIVRGSDDAIIGKDLNGIITSWNRGAERMYGYTASEIIGKSISILIPPDWPNDVPQIIDRIKRGESIEHYETKRMTKDGQILDVALTVSPIRNEYGNIIGVSKIARDITEQKQQEAERLGWLEREREARTEAEQAVRSRDEFLSVAAHELKTPVTSLMGFSQSIIRHINRSGNVDVDRLQSALHHIDEQSHKLAKLINHLLDISRIQAGKLTLECVHTQLNSFLQDIISREQQTTARHYITLNAEADIEAFIDPLRIEQVIANLLDNAIKYSPSGNITVELKLETMTSGNWVVISVTDQGIGIPADKRDHIFERFYQVQPDGSASKGMGLGLYISRQIVELHNGMIEAEFPQEGGTRFIIRLPMK